MTTKHTTLDVPHMAERLEIMAWIERCAHVKARIDAATRPVTQRHETSIAAARAAAKARLDADVAEIEARWAAEEAAIPGFAELRVELDLAHDDEPSSDSDWRHDDDAVCGYARCALTGLPVLAEDPVLIDEESGAVVLRAVLGLPAAGSEPEGASEPAGCGSAPEGASKEQSP